MSNSNPTPHAAGEFGYFLVADIQQRKPFQQFVYFPPALPLWKPFQCGDICQIVLDCELLMKAEVLGQIAEDVPILLPQRLNRDTIINYLTGSGLHNSCDHPH